MTKRVRGVDFSDQELAIIIEFYEENFELLTAKIGQGITFKNKKEAYQKLQAKLAALTGTQRSVEQIKNKWTNLKSK